jgi:hypothetical protein
VRRRAALSRACLTFRELSIDAAIVRGLLGEPATQLTAFIAQYADRNSGARRLRAATRLAEV